MLQNIANGTSSPPVFYHSTTNLWFINNASILELSYEYDAIYNLQNILKENCIVAGGRGAKVSSRVHEGAFISTAVESRYGAIVLGFNCKAISSDIINRNGFLDKSVTDPKREAAGIKKYQALWLGMANNIELSNLSCISYPTKLEIGRTGKYEKFNGLDYLKLQIEMARVACLQEGDFSEDSKNLTVIEGTGVEPAKMITKEGSEVVLIAREVLEVVFSVLNIARSKCNTPIERGGFMKRRIPPVELSNLPFLPSSVMQGTRKNGVRLHDAPLHMQNKADIDFPPPPVFKYK